MKANDGVSCSVNNCTVSSWNNQLSITDVPTSLTNTTAATRPTWSESTFNYNPSVDFTSTSRLFGPANQGIIPFSTNVNSITIIAMAMSNSIAGTLLSDNFRYSTGGSSDQGWQLGLGNSLSGSNQSTTSAIDFRCDLTSVNPNYVQYTSVNSVPAGTPALVSVSKIVSTLSLTTFYRNLNILSTTQTSAAAFSFINMAKVGARVIIGSSDDAQAANWSPSFNGKVSEFVVYTGILTANQRAKVHSYLALKYGITLDRTVLGGDYLNEAGSSVYSDGGVSTYWNNIIGIGRDDNSAFLQKQSRQLDNLTKIYVSTLTVSNIANTGTFTSNNQFVVMGNDGQALNSTGSTEYPAAMGIYSRIEREWKISNTNFNDNFSLDITLNTSPITASDLRILIDDDGNFNNATMYNPTITVSSGVVSISGITSTMIPSNSTKYLTIVSLSSTSPLPIELTRFEAATNGSNHVELNWQTASENNNAYFTLQNSKDGETWQEVATINGAGYSRSLKNYFFSDKFPYHGDSYYRLKQTDFDGRYKYSAIIDAMVTETNQEDILIYPNPTSGKITLEGRSSELKEFTLFNALGADITAFVSFNPDRTGTKIDLDLSALPPDIYLIKTKSGVQKIAKLQ